MKSKISLLLVLLTAAGLLAEADRAPRTPSDILAGPPSSYDMRFVLEPISDMRKLYCSPSVIADRKARGVCVVDSWLVGAYRKEVPLGTNGCVRNALEGVGITNWDGGKQIRIIQRDAILQSRFPRPLLADRAPWRAFGESRIEPGDIVVICYNE